MGIDKDSANFTSLTTVVDDLASKCPEETWLTMPLSPDLVEWKDIKWGELSRAVSKMSRWIVENVGEPESADGRETLTYMGANDMRYAVVILAAIKSGYKILLTSTRNSKEGHLSLLKVTNCTKFLYSEEFKDQVGKLLRGQSGLGTFQVLSVEEMLSPEGNVEHYPGKPVGQKDDNIIIIHTSGSTGLPKPIHYSNAFVNILKVMSDIKPSDSNRKNVHNIWLSNSTMFTMFPFFHGMGLDVLIRSIFCQGPLVVLPTGRPVNADTIIAVLQKTSAQFGVFAPSILEELSDSQPGLEALGALDYVIFGGAPLNRAAGDKINTVTRVNQLLGTTEAGIVPNLEPVDKEDWYYFEWSPEAGADMQPAGDDLFEMVIKRADLRYQAIFHVFPDIDEYRTKDLYQEHSSKPGLYKYSGRLDDVIVLSNGEKFNPVGFEKAVESHHSIKGAVAVGQGKFQTGLIVEPDWAHGDPSEDFDSFLDEIWPAVEEANQDSPAYARVFKSKIAMAKKDKPFARTPKGSIMRRATLASYEKEVDALYSNEGLEEQLGELKGTDLPSVKEYLRNALQLVIPSFKDDTSDDTDIFSLGADSLQVLGVANVLSHAIHTADSKSKMSVTTRTIYSNSTVDTLAKALQEKLGATDSNDTASKISREQKMAHLVHKFTQDLHPVNGKVQHPDKHTVILTGSTGSLGSYILEIFLKDPNIEKVYCMNRSAEAKQRQKQLFESRDEKVDLSKAEFLHVNFGKEYFGLSGEKYAELQSSVDCILHNAWAVDFNMSLESFAGVHLAGVRHFVDLSTESKLRPHILFISSIGSVGNWAGAGKSGEVSEEYYEEFEVAAVQGYGESKHVTEHILAAAAKESGIPSTIIRCGQLAGPSSERGMWNKQEWLPSIVASSKAMGKIPSTLGTQDDVDWVPVDLTAKTVCEIIDARLANQDEKPYDVFHLVNPKTIPWSNLVPVIQEYYASKTDTKVEPVDFSKWVEELQQITPTREEAAAKPAIKLIDFYSPLVSDDTGLPNLSTKHTCETSETLRNLEPIDDKLMGNWLRQWQF